MTTWAPSTTPFISHPWFNMPSAKRKHLRDDDTDSSDNASPTPTFSSTPRRKRRRVSALESGFAHLSLDMPPTIHAPLRAHASAHTPTPVYGAHAYTQPAPGLGPSILELPNAFPNHHQPPPSAAALPVVHPASVEEPPAIPEVRMRTSTWYEPEKDRIVVTSLDDSDEEPEARDAADAHISTALLDRIRARDVARAAPSPPKETSMALVLFKPITFGLERAAEEPWEDGAGATPAPAWTPPQDEDAMDVEP